MDGTAELRQLAHLLRTGAEAARDIAMLRTRDKEEIGLLATQAERMADDLEEIASRSARA